MSIKIALVYCLERDGRLYTAQGGKIQGKFRDLPQLRRSSWEWKVQNYYTSQKRLLVRELALESYSPQESSVEH